MTDGPGWNAMLMHQWKLRTCNGAHASSIQACRRDSDGPRAAPDDDPAQPNYPSKPSGSARRSPQGSERPRQRRRRRRRRAAFDPAAAVSIGASLRRCVACADRCHSAMPRRPSVYCTCMLLLLTGHRHHHTEMTGHAARTKKRSGVRNE